MLLGRFQEAWRESDRIAARGRPDPDSLWDGAPLAGKRVIIRCLHGYGDAIQFIRYARLVRREASRVIVQACPELLALLRGMPFADEVIGWHAPGERIPGWDKQVEVMELARIYRATENTIPRDVPYLRVPWRRRLNSRIPSQAHRPRVGLQWRSSTWNPARSVPFAALEPLLGQPGFEFYNFQRGCSPAEICALARREIYDVSGQSPEIIEAAADLTCIDLLVTADTMMAHLAGALARPVWVLLPFESDWRWMLHRYDSPWYPTMRLFRQPTPGDWQTPVREICRELAHWPSRSVPRPAHIPERHFACCSDR